MFAPINPAPTAQDKTDSDILYYENENDGKGNYKFSFGTADETKREETGRVVNDGQPDQYIQVDGSYSYRYSIPGGYEWRTFYYTAGNDGFNITKMLDMPLSFSKLIVIPELVVEDGGPGAGIMSSDDIAYFSNFTIYLGICLLATSFIFVPINPAPTAQDKTNSDILYYENENDGSGNYKFSFGTADDTKREETGRVVNDGQPDQYIQVDGSYSYRFNIPGGYMWRTFYYTAGKDGFNITKMVRGVHLRCVLAAFAVIALTAGNQLPIKKFIFNNNGLGSYSFEYETHDGSYRKEDGGIVEKDSRAALTVRGEYGFIDPDGFPHHVRYVADFNGYRPQLSDDNIRYNDRRII
ncbi:uncharacterized protein LOC121731196 [Aricia agestis]|uniref:uncharacterized protein LOC121731196 n=1 Tax=Aricia agestis TaxID=91739 RepID=UPI001C2060D2|nr:uncharacterized protein LOC121731196 [Aricia agestis]